MIRLGGLAVIILIASSATAQQGQMPAPGTSERKSESLQQQAESDADFIGLEQAAAEALAKKRGLHFRVGSIDGQPLPGTMDYREDRVTVSIENGKVVSVVRG